MSDQECRSPVTPGICLSPTRTKKSGSDSSRDSNSLNHWDAVTDTLSHKIIERRPSSWDSDDDVAMTFDNCKGHIYSSQTQNHRKSVTAEIDELKKEFFESSMTETEMEDLKERSDLFLGNDRRQSPARVRRRSKSSSSSSTVMDGTLQNSPKRGDDLFPQETLFDNMENFAPLLELNSKFYLDNFFSELRRKRITMLESAIGFDNERDEEDYQENSDDFINCGYYGRTFRKLSQILEVEENKKDSDKDVDEECSENGDLFFKFSPQESLSYRKNESIFKKAKEYDMTSANVEIKNSIKNREGNPLSNEEIISLTAKTGMIHLSSPREEDEKQEDVNVSATENSDLVKSGKSTSRRNSRHGRNSPSSSRKSSRDDNLQSPKFIINLGKESWRSLKVEDLKTPHSLAKSSTPGSERSIKNFKSICPSEPEQEKNILELKSPSLASNPSLELQDIGLDRGMSGRYVNCGEASTRSEFSTKLPLESENSSRSSRSSRLHSQRSEMEETESRRSSITPRTDGHVQMNTPRIENYATTSREESKNSNVRELQSKIKTKNSCNSVADSKDISEDFDNESFSEWVHRSSLGDIIDKENFESVEELAQSRKSLFMEQLKNLEHVGSDRCVKKIRTDSCTLEEVVNIEKSDELKATGRSTDRSILEECESIATQRSRNDSESDRKLSVIDEVSQEEIVFESPKLSSGGYRSDRKMTPENLVASHRSLKEKSNESINKPKCEGLWNDLIETFSEDQKQPFNWEDNFTNFLNKNNVINSDRESSAAVVKDKFLNFEKDKAEQVDFIMSTKLTENVFWSPRKSEKISSPEKGSDKKKDFLDLDEENNPRKKIKSESEAQNLYYFKVKRSGNLKIGEFGDVTCWNLGTPDALEDRKPKGHGDGIQYLRKTPNLNPKHWQNDSKTHRQIWINLKDTRINSKAQKFYRTNDDLNSMSIFQSDLKPSKSDSSINATEFIHYPRVASSNENVNKSKTEKELLFENALVGNPKKHSSSSECLSEETENQEFVWEKVRRSTSLLDIPASSWKTPYKKTDSNENLKKSQRGSFETTKKTDAPAKQVTNFKVFLTPDTEQTSKFNWLTLHQNTKHRQTKKSTLKIDKTLIKKHSKEYLSFRTRHPLPVLKLTHSNCFQNFYKRVISVFCMTPNSSLPSSK